MHRAFTVSGQIFAQSLFFLGYQQSHFQVSSTEPFVGTGVDPGFNATTLHQKILNTDPFGNICEADEVSPEVEVGVVARLRCLQP